MSSRLRGARVAALLALGALQPLAAGAGPPRAVVAAPSAAATPCVTPGHTLSFSAPATIALPSIALGGTAQTVSASADFTVIEQTPANSGWSIAGTSTEFADLAGDVLPANVTSVAAAGATAAPGPCNTAPANVVGYPVTLPAGSAPPRGARLYAARAGTGTGSTMVNLTFNVALPATATAGTYSSTWILTVQTGP